MAAGDPGDPREGTQEPGSRESILERISKRTGEMPRVSLPVVIYVLTALAADLATRTGLPVPRFVDSGRGPALLRASCCRLFRLPRGALCTACPRRLALERVHD